MMVARVSRRTVVTGLAGSAIGAGAARARMRRPPNVLFILADDLGAHDLRCFGHPDHRTPAIDRLCTEGLAFDQAYANSPTCSPTRTALISGQYQYRHPVGLYDPLPRGSRLGYLPQAQSLPGLFAQAGYRTALVGKWHLGALPDFGPLRSGYDEFFGPMESAMDYVSHRPMGAGAAAASMLYDGEHTIEMHGYATDLFTERACHLIERWRAHPFLLSLHYTAPHFPWQAPGDAPTDEQVSGNHDAGSHAIYARMVGALDAGVGRVLRTIERHGLADDTIVVFTSDNGGERYSFQWPLRGTKSELWEGGIRVPAIVRWPGRVPRARTRLQTMTMDWLPTLLKLVGAAETGAPFDGADLSDAMRAPAVAGSPERTLFWRTEDMAAVRRGRWKYVRDEAREYLFDVDADPGERANQRLRQPGIVAVLRERFDAWNATMLAVPADARRPRVRLRQEFEALDRR
jgi:arylsulfatase A-like enzyme